MVHRNAETIKAMTRQQIIELQSRIGTTPDGFWGPASIRACQMHLKRMAPATNPWPLPDDISMRKFFGREGDESNLTNLPVTVLGVLYEGRPVKTIRCHKKVADSLLRALTAIAAGPAAWILREYGGCYNHRPMRGGSRPSKHSWGAAIDLAPGTNGLRTSWPMTANMPIEAMEAFAREGWTSAGAFWGRDAMHFEATRF